MHVVVVNHLHFRDPVSEATVQAFRDGVRLTVDSGGLAARVLRVDEQHLIPGQDPSSASSYRQSLGSREHAP